MHFLKKGKNMSFQYIREMPTVSEILAKMPLSEDLKRVKKKRDEEIKAVFRRESEKFIVIIGPCSADDRSHPTARPREEPSCHPAREITDSDRALVRTSNVAG